MVAKILLSNSLSSIQDALLKELDNLKINKNSPDVLYLENDMKLGVEQIRKIKEFLYMKAYNSKGKIVILENGENLTNEAQNALLKNLEELSEDNLFLIGATSESKFLPTILSRCQIVRVKGEGERGKGETQIQDIEKLLNAEMEERFEYVEKLKDKEEFLFALVEYFHQNLALNPGGLNVNNFLKELLRSEQWAKQNVNIRGILEYLMLKMPNLS